MSKTIIIPDIHHRLNCVEQILTKESPYDKAIFLGDWFDDYGDTPIKAEKTARALQISLHNPKHVHLWGNHDISYAFDNNSYASCSGWTSEKYEVIQNFLKNEWKHFKFYTFEQDWLLSHAGLSLHNIPAVWETHNITVENVTHYLNRESIGAMSYLVSNRDHWMYRCGFSRGGSTQCRAGGLTWCDFDDEFHPIKGLSQIFGHTVQQRLKPTAKRAPDLDIDRVCKFQEFKEGSEIHKQDDWSVCLDTNSRHYAVLTNGIVQIKLTL
jgi:hypothetical protein